MKIKEKKQVKKYKVILTEEELEAIYAFIGSTSESERVQNHGLKKCESALITDMYSAITGDG